MTDLDTLNEAIRCIDSERQSVQSEADGFRAFRDVVGRAQPAASCSGTGATRTDFAERYREMVMSAEYKETYGPSLADSLKTELTPSTAAAVLTDEALTHQQKRNLLQATNRAVKQREQFDNILAREYDSLVLIRANLRDILTSMEDLPPCRLHQLTFSDYLDVWNETTALLTRCDELLQDRQDAVRATNHPVQRGGDHDLSEYLYAELRSTYPALMAIADTRQRIQRHRQPTATTDTPDHGSDPNVGQDSHPRVNGSSD